MLPAPPGTERITLLDDAWTLPRRGTRHRAIRVGGEKLRDRFAQGARAVSVRTFPLSSAPYPTKYAFRSAASSPVPLVTFTHRCLLVQFFQRGALKNLLFNPTDIDAARQTPYFAKLIEKFGRFEKFLQKNTIRSRRNSRRMVSRTTTSTTSRSIIFTRKISEVSSAPRMVASKRVFRTRRCSRRNASGMIGMICIRCSARGSSPTDAKV